MQYVWAGMLVLVNAVWLGLVLFGLPGNWLIVISTCLFAWWQWDKGVFSVYILAAIVILSVAGEIVEFFAGAAGARRAGAGWRGAIGAIVGGAVGAIVGTIVIAVPVLGTLIGACVGAGIGALVLELTAGKKVRESIGSGIGAGIGKFAGTTAKFFIGAVIWLMVAVAAFWP
jgi:hypothetical protein